MKNRTKRTISFLPGLIEPIKEGKITHTRRIIHFQPDNQKQEFSTIISSTHKKDENKHRYMDKHDTSNCTTSLFRCRYGYTGHILRVENEKNLSIHVNSVRADRLCNSFEGIDCQSYDEFKYIWYCMYGLKAWKDNPYVWIIGFNALMK